MIKYIIRLVLILILFLVNFEKNIVAKEADIKKSHLSEQSDICSLENLNKMINNSELSKSERTKYVYKNSDFIIIKDKPENLENIYIALDYLNIHNVSNVPNPVCFVNEDESGVNSYLVYSYLEGSPILIRENTRLFKLILDNLLEFDKVLFFHLDLNYANILYDKEKNKINIIDFDSYKIIDNNGILYWGNSSPPYDYVDKRFISSIKFSKDNEFQYSIDNPVLNLYSNISLFEVIYLFNQMFFCTSYPGEESCEKLFKDYLNAKSKIISERSKYLESYIKLVNTGGEYAKEKKILQEAVKIEKIKADVLKYPTSDVIELEKAKLLLRGFFQNKKYFTPLLFTREINNQIEKIDYYAQKIIDKNFGDKLYEYAIIQQILNEKYKTNLKNEKFNFIKGKAVNGYKYIFEIYLDNFRYTDLYQKIRRKIPAL